jgi:tRNA modification GTPase
LESSEGLHLPAADGVPIVVTSSRTGQGLDELCAAMRAALLNDVAGGSQAAIVGATAERCQESVQIAAESVGRALVAAADAGGEELIAAEIRVALDEIGRVVGSVCTDDILERIFSSFCIGK